MQKFISRVLKEQILLRAVIFPEKKKDGKLREKSQSESMAYSQFHSVSQDDCTTTMESFYPS